MSLDDEIDALYAGPLDAFTPGRDALAKRLRGEGDRDAAQRVKALRKPSVAAWGLNRLRAERPERVDLLLAAASELREAQTQLLTTRDRERLRTAAANEREAVETLVDEAEEELRAGGQSASAAVRSKLFATLHAVAADEEARTLLATGRLTRDYAISDFGFDLEGVDLPDAPPEPEPEEREKPEEPEPDPHEAQHERERAELTERIEVAEAELAAATTDTDAAEQALAAAHDRERRAAATVDDLRARLDELGTTTP
jgi:hypothetical protein